MGRQSRKRKWRGGTLPGTGGSIRFCGCTGTFLTRLIEKVYILVYAYVMDDLFKNCALMSYDSIRQKERILRTGCETKGVIPKVDKQERNI